jgi:hypothetical protein
MCNVQALITNCLLLFENGEVTQEMLTPQSVFNLLLVSQPLTSCTLLYYRQRNEYKVYLRLLEVVPRLEERIMGGSDEEYKILANLVRLLGQELVILIVCL